jgi:hypothetical protein
MRTKKTVMEATMRCSYVGPVVYDSKALTYSTSITNSSCTMTAFGTKMRGFRTEIATAASAVDAVVTTNFDPIFNELWDVASEKLFVPVQWIGETLNCQFVSLRWNTLFRALCVVFTPTMIRLGKTLFTLGFAGIFFTVVQILVWRHLKDNHCLWSDAVGFNARASARLGRRVSTFTRLRPTGLINSFRDSAAWLRSMISLRRSSSRGNEVKPGEPLDIPQPKPEGVDVPVAPFEDPVEAPVAPADKVNYRSDEEFSAHSS